MLFQNKLRQRKSVSGVGTVVGGGFLMSKFMGDRKEQSKLDVRDLEPQDLRKSQAKYQPNQEGRTISKPKNISNHNQEQDSSCMSSRCRHSIKNNLQNSATQIPQGNTESKRVSRSKSRNQSRKSQSISRKGSQYLMSGQQPFINGSTASSLLAGDNGGMNGFSAMTIPYYALLHPEGVDIPINVAAMGVQLPYRINMAGQSNGGSTNSVQNTSTDNNKSINNNSAKVTQYLLQIQLEAGIMVSKNGGAKHIYKWNRVEGYKEAMVGGSNANSNFIRVAIQGPFRLGSILYGKNRKPLPIRTNESPKTTSSFEANLIIDPERLLKEDADKRKQMLKNAMMVQCNGASAPSSRFVPVALNIPATTNNSPAAPSEPQSIKPIVSSACRISFNWGQNEAQNTKTYINNTRDRDVSTNSIKLSSETKIKCNVQTVYSKKRSSLLLPSNSSNSINDNSQQTINKQIRMSGKQSIMNSGFKGTSENAHEDVIKANKARVMSKKCEMDASLSIDNEFVSAGNSLIECRSRTMTNAMAQVARTIAKMR